MVAESLSLNRALDKSLEALNAYNKSQTKRSAIELSSLLTTLQNALNDAKKELRVAVNNAVPINSETQKMIPLVFQALVKLEQQDINDKVEAVGLPKINLFAERLSETASEVANLLRLLGSLKERRGGKAASVEDMDELS